MKVSSKQVLPPSDSRRLSHLGKWSRSPKPGHLIKYDQMGPTPADKSWSFPNGVALLR